MVDLVRFLGNHPPFDALDERVLHSLAAAAVTVDFPAGSQILDAFQAPSEEMFVVLSGRVELWNSPPVPGEPADEVIGTGGVFGYSALLTRAAVGPLATASGPVRAIRLPGSAVAPAFSSAAGLRFLAQNLNHDVARPSAESPYGVVDQLIFSAPLVVQSWLTVIQVAGLMTDQNARYAVIELAGEGYGLVTDAVLRARVVAAGLPSDTPIGTVMAAPAPFVLSGTLAAQALLELTERNLDCLLVLDRNGELRGLVAREDFVVSPSTAGISLREQIARTRTIDQLVVLAHRLPLLMGDLLRRGRSAAEATTVQSTVIDAIARRALDQVFADRPDLDPTEFTWLSMGSNGRREPVPNSDIDAAVVFSGRVDTAARAESYRDAFRDVAALLQHCGLSIDRNGALPGEPSFARTGSQWRSAAQEWMKYPLDNNGLMMTSLLLDARPIQGDPELAAVDDVFADMRGHPGTLRLLLAESLTNRARLRSMRDVLARRGGTFDLKTHALRPVVDIARWAALAVGSRELSTRARLAAAAGSPMLPDDQADILGEVFEVLQKTRLRYQLGQIERGEPPSDVLSLRRLSPLDRSLIGQAVREIAAVQRRMANLSQLTPPDTW